MALSTESALHKECHPPNWLEERNGVYCDRSACSLTGMWQDNWLRILTTQTTKLSEPTEPSSQYQNTGLGCLRVWGRDRAVTCATGPVFIVLSGSSTTILCRNSKNKLMGADTQYWTVDISQNIIRLFGRCQYLHISVVTMSTVTL